MWMWSGAHGSTHDSDARGPGFDPNCLTDNNYNDKQYYYYSKE